VTTQIRIRCTDPFHAEVLLDEAPGKLLLNVLGRSYEGFLARGEGAQVIRALTKLAKEDNTGTITLVPKLANYLLRIVTERIAHFAYRMNQVNDKVENQRWGKNGLKLTDEMLEASQGHDEIYRLSQVLTVLTLASRHYANVYFIREDLEDKEDDEDESDLTSGTDYSELDDDDMLDEDETPEEIAERISSESPTTQRRTISEARGFGIDIVGRLADCNCSGHALQFISMHEVMTDAEKELWANKPDYNLLYSAIVQYIKFAKNNHEHVVVRELTQAEANTVRHPEDSQLFAVEQLPMPKAGIPDSKVQEIAGKVFKRATGHSVDGQPPILKPEGVERWVVSVETFMTVEEREMIAPMETNLESSLSEMFAHHYESKDSEKTGLYRVLVACESQCPADDNHLYLVVTDLPKRANS
jgi:hypothetical protein